MRRAFARLLPTLAALALVGLPFAPAQEDEGRKYALLIGVDKYDGTGLRNLSYAEKDVADLAAVLKECGYKVTLVTRSEFKKQDQDHLLPTAANIREHLASVMRDRRPGDTVLVAFSGHGAHLKGTDKLYFCPTGTKLGDPKTLIVIDDVMAAFKGCKAGSKVLLMDACRNDPADGRAVGAPGEFKSSTRPLLPDLPGGTVALFSCSKGQIAYESDVHKRGFLFHCVIEGLEGKAANKRDEVTWLSLVKHVEDELPEAVKKEKGPQANQSPEVRGDSRTMALGRVAGLRDRKQAEADFRAYEKAHSGLREALEQVEGPKKAAEWKRAAEAGVPAGQFLFARCLDAGLGTEQNVKEAVAWYKKAAEAGVPLGMARLGLMYANGSGVEKDYAEALRWYRKAAEAGEPLGQNNLGQMYLLGHGVEKNYAEAARWYRKAAEAGEPWGMSNLAVMYEKGAGVEKNYREAVRLHKKAAELGNSQAKKELERLGEK